MREDSETSNRLGRLVGRTIFGEDAAGYDIGRLGYPDQLYDDLLGGIPNVSALSVFEVGAGTGLATRDLLARRPGELVAIEPDLRLATFLLAELSNSGHQFRVQIAPFEESRLESEAFDIGVAASCFHWVDPDQGWSAAYRLLRPGGRWAMWWNVYRAVGIGDDFADAAASLFEHLALPPSEGPARHVSLESDYQQGLLKAAGFGDVAMFLYRRERMLDAQTMRALYASFSFVRKLSNQDREQFLDSISELVKTRFGGAAPNIVLTPLYLGVKP